MLTEKQQEQIDAVVATLTSQFEAANAAAARIKAMEPKLHKETVRQDLVTLK